MGNKKGTAPKNADKLQDQVIEDQQIPVEDQEASNEAPEDQESPVEETKTVTDDKVIVVGTGTGLLENGAKYTCTKETADFHVARGYATLLTDQEADA